MPIIKRSQQLESSWKSWNQLEYGKTGSGIKAGDVDNIATSGQNLWAENSLPDNTATLQLVDSDRNNAKEQKGNGIEGFRYRKRIKSFRNLLSHFYNKHKNQQNRSTVQQKIKTEAKQMPVSSPRYYRIARSNSMDRGHDILMQSRFQHLQSLIRSIRALLGDNASDNKSKKSNIEYPQEDKPNPKFKGPALFASGQPYGKRSKVQGLINDMLTHHHTVLYHPTDDKRASVLPYQQDPWLLFPDLAKRYIEIMSMNNQPTKNSNKPDEKLTGMPGEYRIM